MANSLATVLKTRLSSPLEVLKRDDFRRLWLGEFCSLLGDQFYWIALPWLILQLTGDPLVMGSLLAVQMIPRSLFMLIGGALTDRFSPRSVMLASVLSRFLLIGTLTALVFSGVLHLWMLYILALLFGLVDGFFFPAQNSIVPSLLDTRELPAGNALIQGTAQFSMFLGPAVAGALIALLDSPGTVIPGGRVVQDLQGIGLALGIDCFGYLCSALLLGGIKTHPPLKQASEEEHEIETVWAAIRSGLTYAWRNADLRVFFMIVAAMSLIVNGSITVGVPVLAHTRFPEGAAAFGIIVSSFGGGSLLGILLVSTLPPPPPKRVGRILLIVLSVLGIGLMLLSITNLTFLAALIALASGIGGGYILITVITWLQQRTPKSMLGRIMSLLTFATLGLNPFAMAIAGALSKLSVTGLLFGSGAILALIALVTAFTPIGRLMEG